MRSSLVAAVSAVALLTVPSLALAQSVGTNVAVIDIGEVFKNHRRFRAAMEDIKADINSGKMAEMYKDMYQVGIK